MKSFTKNLALGNPVPVKHKKLGIGVAIKLSCPKRSKPRIFVVWQQPRNAFCGWYEASEFENIIRK